MLKALYVGLLACVTCFGGLAHAENVTDFYSRHPITLVVGYDVGGSYDMYGRLVAEFLGRHLPGHPAVAVKNMVGGGSFNAANYMYNQAPRDGTFVGLVGQSLLLSQAFHYPGVSFDMTKFGWLGRVSTQVEATVVSTRTHVTTIQGATTKKIVLAANAPQANAAAFPRLLNRVIGTKFDIIVGYPGVASMFLAMERGEVDGAHTDTAALLTDRRKLLDEKKISVLVQYSNEPDPAFPEVPTLLGIARTDADKKLFSIFGNVAEIGRAFMEPPHIPEDRLEAMRLGFAQMMSDPDFISAAHNRNIEMAPLAGAGVQAVISQTINVAPDLLARAAKVWEAPR